MVQKPGLATPLQGRRSTCLLCWDFCAAPGQQRVDDSDTLKQSPPPRLVLDTNVVLDWLIFQNEDAALIGQAIQAGDVIWLTSESLRKELMHVLARDQWARWAPIQPNLWAHWNRWSSQISCASVAQLPRGPRCTDTDDQKFIDLALGQHAHWLISRDKAVLKLGRPCLSMGLRIVEPEQWALLWRIDHRSSAAPPR